MPSSNFSDPAAFRIALDNPYPFYSGGDIVSGRVVFNAVEDQPIGQVRISLIGRAKTKIFRNNGQSRSVYRGRAVFFDIPIVLHNGKFTHKADTYSWPFSLPIAAGAQPSLLAGDKWDHQDGYLSTEDQIAANTLPPSYRCNFLYRSSHEAFVEYKLLAQLIEPADSHRFLEPRTYETELHLELSTPVSDYPLSNLSCNKLSSSMWIRTYRLRPEYADPTQKLSFKQKTHSFFGRSSVPTFNFILHVTLPTVVQLDHPDGLPVIINAEAVRLNASSDEESSTASDSNIMIKHSSDSPFSPSLPMPQITLNHFSIIITAQTRSRAKMALFGGYVNESHTEKVPVAEKVVGNLRVPLTPNASITNQHSTPEFSDKKQQPQLPLNLGAMYNIRLAQKSATQPPPGNIPALIPNFRTCNIQLAYSWRFKCEVECAGETETVDFRDLPLEVLGRARGNQPAQPWEQTNDATGGPDGSFDQNGANMAPPMYDDPR